MNTIVNRRNLTVEENDEGPRNIMIHESEGKCAVFRPSITSMDVTKALNLRQVNIGIEEQPKLAKIGDYWDDDTVGKVVELLTEY